MISRTKISGKLVMIYFLFNYFIKKTHPFAIPHDRRHTTAKKITNLL